MSNRRRSDRVLVEGVDYVIDKNISEGDDDAEDYDEYFESLTPVELWMIENQCFTRDIWYAMNIIGPSDN